MMGILAATLLLLVLGASGAHAGTSPPVVVTAKEITEIDSPRIRMGQIVTIDAETSEMSDRLARIEIGRAPLAGKTRGISREYILLRLRQSGIDPRTLDLRLPAKIRVRRSAVRITREEMEMMVRDHLMATASSDEAEVNITAVRIKDDVLLPKGKIHHEVQRLHQSAPSRMQPVSIVFKVDGRFVRKVSALVSLEIMQNVVVSRKPIPRFKVITAQDVMMRQINVASMADTVIRSIERVVGKRARRAIGMHDAMHTNMVEWPPVVQKGDRVTIIAESGSLRITALGEVRGTGKVGEQVRVVNLDSKKNITAQVVDHRTVRVVF
jgi:flagella basal body P-ring formation protein FlgA